MVDPIFVRIGREYALAWDRCRIDRNRASADAQTGRYMDLASTNAVDRTLWPL